MDLLVKMQLLKLLLTEASVFFRNFYTTNKNYATKVDFIRRYKSMILNKINALHPRTRGEKVRGVGAFREFNKGFSLVELVIVIAILAILIAVLAPSLMTYTERSRAQKDVTTMDEVVNAVQLAMADQNCYDEMIKYSCENNFITYTDSSGNYGQVVADGEFWAPDGSGRATTITFNPTRKGNETYYVLETGIVNDMTYGNGSVRKDA